MIRVPVEMRYSPSRQRDAVAWFVPGETSREWLDELTRWGVPLAPLRLWIVPCGAADRTPCGVLVTESRMAALGRPYEISNLKSQTLNQRTAEGGHPTSGVAIPYGCIAGRLFVPVEATFVPPLDERDWRDLLPTDEEPHEKSICVWHPTAGFVTFDESQCLRVADLLQAPQRRAADWNQARPGVSFNSRLTAVLPVVVPSLESLLDEGREDIGSRGDDWSELPRRTNEPSDGALSKLGQRAMLGAAAAGAAMVGAVGSVAGAIGRGLRALTGGAASGSGRRGSGAAGESGWSHALEKAMQNMVERMRQALEPARQKAVRRLMELLEKNPDEGLKFAIPFGDEPHRGTASPSDQLAERPVNFDLNQLRGGGPADRWSIPNDQSLQLMARYRELANRELQLGRHRRAAYIFGHLLHDFAAAANALAAGKHWRDAAVLYRDKLHLPLDAARCLEQGGLLTEAIEIYDEQKMFEKAGDLFAQLEQPDEARQRWSQASVQLMQSNNFLAAAKLTETKLANQDAALDLLDAGWQRSIQAEACLSESFRLLARMGNHPEASRRIEHWRDADESVTVLLSPALLVQQLAEVTTTYPDDGVRQLAGDSARVLTARHWKTRPASEHQRLLKSIVALAPEDRLLARDTRRFLAERVAPTPKLFPFHKSAHPSKPPLRLLRQWQLRGDVEWLTATSSQQYWFALGTRGSSQVVVRGDWSQTLPPSDLALPNFGEPLGDPLLLSVAAEDDGPLVVRQQCKIQKTVRRWQSSARGLDFDRPPTWLQPNTVAICRTPGIVWVLRDEPECFIVEGYSETSDLLLHTQQINHSASDEPSVWPNPFFVDSSGRKYVGEGEKLLMPHFDGGWTSDRGAIQSLAGMTFERVTRLVLTFESGGEILWDDGSEIHSARLSDDYSHPVATFTRRGHLVVADRTTCEVFNVDGHNLRLRAQTPGTGSRPLAVLATPHLDQFVLLTADGQMRHFEVPRP